MKSTDKYPIVSNIPIPHKRISPLEEYPFTKMRVGDSFFVPVEDKDTKKEKEKKGRIVSKLVATPNTKLAPKKFAARQVEGGVRVWRIK